MDWRDWVYPIISSAVAAIIVSLIFNPRRGQ